MRKSLGSLFALLLLALAPLQGYEDFDYRIESETLTPYLKEGVRIDVSLKQKDTKKVLLFSFAPQKSDDYRIEELTSEIDETPHHTKAHYRYILYPLKGGNITVHFTLLKRITDEHKLAYTASGDRDDSKGIEATEVPVVLPPLELHVKGLPHKSDLVGDFHIESRLSATLTEPYKPVTLRVRIEGSGYPPLVHTLLPPIDGVTRFSETPKLTPIKEKTGIRYRADYLIALSAARNFKIPVRILHAFDPKKERSYTLTIPERNITVKRVDVTALRHEGIVDTKNTPPHFRFDWDALYRIVSYLAAFVAGWLSASFYPILRRKRRATRLQNPLVAKIEACRDPKRLVALLFASRDAALQRLGGRLADALDAQAPVSLKAYKKEALSLLQKEKR